MPQFWGIEPVAQDFCGMGCLAGGTFGTVVRMLTVNTYRAVGQITQTLGSGSAQQSCQGESDGELHICRFEAVG